MKSFLSVLFVFSVVLSMAQNLSITGKIADAETDLPVESATVYLSRVQDSTLVDYTISDHNGNFELNIRKTDRPTQLKISNIVYKPYTQNFQSIENNIDLGKIKLDIQSTLIDSIEIKFEIPPIRIKNDTLEFNASSFKVRPDANVEALLRQLPGVEIDSEGVIKVNGKQVNQILVNGKPFFDADGKIALQNLPAEIINKVQVTDKKTKEQEISGEASTTDDLSINLTIDPDKNKGYFGRIMAGYGTDDKYETSGLVNYFKGDLRVSLLASSNNINASGFSMDEVFDNMSGIRSVRTSGSGGLAVNGVNFGGMNTGITQSNLIGLNYADKWFDKADATGSYFYSDSSTKNQNKTQTVNLLPDNYFTSTAESYSQNDTSNHNVNFGLEIKIDSTSTLWISPNLSKSNNRSRSNMSQASFDEFDDILNQSTSENYSENKNTSFNNSIYYFKRLRKKGRTLSVNFRNNNSNSVSENLTQSATYFYQSAQEDDIRHQKGNNNNKQDNYSLSLTYKEPLTDSLNISLGLNYHLSKSSDTKEVFDFDQLTQDFTQQNNLLSNSIFSQTNSFNPNLRFELRKSKYNADINLGTHIYDFENSSWYLSEHTILNKNYIVPALSANIRYRISKSSSFSTRYNYRENLPNASQLLPVENLTNPLNTIIGNPELDLNKSHSLNLNFNDYDYASRSGYSIYLFSTYNTSRVASVSQFDQDRKQTTTYTNINNTYNVQGGLNWDKSYTTENGHKYGYSVGASGNYNFNKGFTNTQLYQAVSKNITPRIGLTYEYAELLTIYPNYRFTYNQTDYTNYHIGSSWNVIHRINLETTSYFPENFVFGNDFGYTYNSNITRGFRKDFFLWNISMAYSFWNKKMTAKIKVYDLLNQNISNSRQISDIAIIDSENLILKRYVMFSLSYKLENFAGKSSDERENRRGASRNFRIRR